MKIALYIEDGLEQIVLTPETPTEKAIVEKLSDDSRDLSIRSGQFYECRGGYMRFVPAGGYTNQTMDSTMIVLRPKVPPLAGPPL